MNTWLKLIYGMLVSLFLLSTAQAVDKMNLNTAVKIQQNLIENRKYHTPLMTEATGRILMGTFLGVSLIAMRGFTLTLFQRAQDDSATETEQFLFGLVGYHVVDLAYRSSLGAEIAKYFNAESSRRADILFRRFYNQFHSYPSFKRCQEQLLALSSEDLDRVLEQAEKWGGLYPYDDVLLLSTESSDGYTTRREFLDYLSR